MATFTVRKFHTAGGAEDALGTLERLQTEELITVEDAAIVSWPADKKKPKTRHLSEAFPAADAELIHTDLSAEDEAKLREAFSPED